MYAKYPVGGSSMYPYIVMGIVQPRKRVNNTHHKMVSMYTTATVSDLLNAIYIRTKVQANFHYIYLP